MKNPSDFLSAIGVVAENSKPVDLYSNVVHVDIDETEKFLEAFNAQLIDELDHMDEVGIL